MSLLADSHSDDEVRILVVDDDEGIRDMLSFLLSRLGYRVVLAANGLEALGLFLKNSFSLVLTDFSMPEMDGITLAARVKITSPKTPIIMITGSQIQEGVERGCVDYILSKPFQLEEVRRAVEMALAGTPHRAGMDHGAEMQVQG